MAYQSAELEIVRTGHFGKVVFPNEKVLVILPRSLVPKGGISISTPKSGQAHPRRLREDGGKLRGDLVIKCRARFIRRNVNVVAGPRELKLVNGSRTQGRRQLDGKSRTGLIPIRAKGWERIVAPKGPYGAPGRPALVWIFEQ